MSGSHTLESTWGLVLSTPKPCPGSVSPGPDLSPKAEGEVRSSGTHPAPTTAVLGPQLRAAGTALGLRGQPSARLQNSSCVHIKASNERKMPFLAPRALSAGAVWQAEWASTVWQREGRKGRCESDLGPQPLCMDRPANCINKCLDAGPVGGQGQGAAPIPTGSSRHKEGDHGQGCGPGLRHGFASRSCSKAEDSLSTLPKP